MTRAVPRFPDQELPKQLGRYFVTQQLKVGGMASVYLAELCGPAGFRKKVALKLLAITEPENGEEKTLPDTSTEARLGGLLHHPNIVDVYELGDWQGYQFIAMEWVDGLTLSELVQTIGPPPPAVVLEIASAIALALETAHTLALPDSTVGLFHRDIKPSNIMVTRNGEVKLVDFGIATTSAASVPAFRGGKFSLVGTPSYMAPEQLLGRPVDARSDLYGLGLVLALLTTGKRIPKNYLLNRVMNGKTPEVPVINPEMLEDIEQIAPGLGTLLAKTTHPKASQRFQSAAELYEAIESLRDAIGFRPRLRTWLREALQAHPETANPPKQATESASQKSAPSAFEEETVVIFPSNLVESSDAFVGRKTYLETLKTKASGEVPVVTVLGTGGTGKTRLAKQCGRALQDGFPGGVWFIDLTEATEEWAFLQTISEVLALPVPKQEPLSQVAQVGYGLDGMGKALIILDNFEQIAEQASTTVELWCRMSPETRFIVTSRIRLNIQGEHVLELPPLNPDEAVELFYHRATHSGFVANRSVEERDVVREMVRTVDCLPLAIEMAAARTRVLHPKQLLQGLKESRDLLSIGRIGQEGRQGNLHSLMDWSWGLLEPWEQSALAQLAVFEGGFSLEAALTTLNLSEFWPKAPSVLEVVTALYNHSLLHSQATDLNPRFGMYVTVRDFALSKLQMQKSENIEQSIHHRHAMFFAGLGEFQTFWGLHYEPGASRVDSVRQDLQNCLAAMRWLEKTGDYEAAAKACLAACSAFHGDDAVGSRRRLLEHANSFALSPELAARIVGQIVHVRQAMGYAGFADLVDQIEAVLPSDGQWNNPEQELALRCILLSVLRSPDMADRARVEFERCEALSLRLGTPFFHALACLHFGNIQAHGANDNSAEALFEQATALFKDLGADGHYVLALGNLASRLLRIGRYKEAEMGLNQALKINRRLQRKAVDTFLMCNLGSCQFVMGRDEEAERTFRRVIELAQELRDVQTEGSARNNLGALMSRAGRFFEAIEWLESAKLARGEASIYDGVADGNIGNLLIEIENFAEARKRLQLAIAQLEENLKWASAVFLGSIALLDALEGHFERAEQRLLDAIEQLRHFNQVEFGKLHAKGYLIYRLMGKDEEAANLLKVATQINEMSQNQAETDIDFILDKSVASRRVGTPSK